MRKHYQVEERKARERVRVRPAPMPLLPPGGVPDDITVHKP